MESKVVITLTEGALLNPSEVRYQTDADLGWALAAIVDAESFDAFRRCNGSTRVHRRITWLAPNFGGEFLLVTHQVGSMQHRFLMSAYDRHTHTWVRTLASAQFCCMYTKNRDGAPPHLVVRDKLDEQTLATFEGVAQLELPCDARAHLTQMSRMVQIAATPNFVPSMQAGVDVRKIVVSPVHPGAIAPYNAIRVVGIE